MKTSVTVDRDLWWKFKEEAARRRRAEKDALDEALRDYVAGTSTSGLTDERARYAQAFVRAIRTAPDIYDAVKPMLERFIEAPAGAHEEKPHQRKRG